ncbi:TatD family hydrolase [Romboutsia sp. Marseille-P6047]|uniref:TatD family hydrolase n=1 Tax=Romboutsia sp. Marseille-P6047 TaxID=2161817 RepID=UPI000822B8B1|nr:TatD family hydrolase [Romboutsia sp. Marseille-P6047]SCH32142.1 Uncharacterized deoxyribonuclease YjjV [uncultured Clostridium sp.]
MYIDFHNHIDFYSKDKVNEVINIINKEKIITIACAMDEKSYIENIGYSNKSDYIIPIFGIHPSKVKNNKFNFDKIENYIKYAPLIGEIGLDFYWVEEKETYLNQIEVFEYFLQTAKKYNKYINVHTKGAEELVLDYIKKYDVSEQTIIHWYSGEEKTLEKLIDIKCLFTGSVDLGYSDKTNEIIKKIPINQLLAETDGPTALQWVNNIYGMPDEIKKVYKKISDIKNVEVEEFKEHCSKILKEITNFNKK